jgi:hypothetical protein
MAITPDTSAANATVSGTTLDTPYTLGVGAQIWLMCIVHSAGAGIPDFTSVKYNGVDITEERDSTDGLATHMRTYQSFTTPLTGDGASHTLAIVFDRTVDKAIVAIASFFGVSTTTTLATNTTGTSAAPSSGSLSPTAGTLVVDAVGIIGAFTPTQNGAQTLITNGNIPNNGGLGYGISTRAGGSSFSMDWTVTSAFWFSQSIILNPAVTGSPQASRIAKETPGLAVGSVRRM